MVLGDSPGQADLVDVLKSRKVQMVVYGKVDQAKRLNVFSSQAIMCDALERVRLALQRLDLHAVHIDPYG